MADTLSLKTAPKRTPIAGQKNKLSVKGKDPRFEYRFVNDTPGRIEMFEEAGWQPDTSKDIKIGDRRVTKESNLGSVHTLNAGGGTKSILMKQLKEHYIEDQLAKQAEIDQLEQSMKKPKVDGTYGSIKIEKIDK